MREQRLSRLRRVTQSQRHACQERNQRRFKSVLKKHCEIKLPALPLAHLREDRKRVLPIVNQHFIDKVGVRKDPFCAGTSDERDCASGKTRLNARSAGIVIRESPTQFVPRTTTRLILSAGTLLIPTNFLQDHSETVIDSDLRAPVQLFLN